MSNRNTSLKTIAWPSHSRPELLQRSIQSFIESLGSDADSYHFILALSGENQIIPSTLSQKKVTLIDDHYREKLVMKLEEGLIEKGFDPGIAKFALDAGRKEGSEGAHRNAINLISINQNYLSCDDDIIFDLKTLSQESLKDFISLADWDSLKRLEGEANSFSLAEFLHAHEEALQRTVFSSPGIRGHSIYGGPRFIFTFNDSSLEKLCEDQDFFEKALGSRLLWNEAQQSMILPYFPAATYMLGMNNTFMLPPCFPFGRNLDGSFVYATKALNPSSETARVKGTVLHRPPEYRGAYSSLESFELRINDILWLMWAEWFSQASKYLSIEDRYFLSGKYFQEIAQKSTERFSDSLTQLISKSLLDRARVLEGQRQRLKNHALINKSSWPQLVEKEISLCLARANSRSPFIPLEAEGRDDSLELTQKWISNYGQTIEAWPVMRSLAQEFHQNSVSFKESSL